MIACYLALGSNLNAPPQQIRRAIKALNQLPHTQVKKVSDIYRSIPAGGLIEPLYYNAVVLIHTRLSPTRLLYFCQLIETKQKRLRSDRFRSRSIDIDILLYGDQMIRLPQLIVPHPRLHLRDFVLIPLLSLWPTARLPDGTLLSESLQTLTNYHVNSLEFNINSLI